MFNDIMVRNIIFSKYINKYISNTAYCNIYDLQIIQYIIDLIFMTSQEDNLMIYKNKLLKKNININILKKIFYESYNYSKLYKENVHITGDFIHISLPTIITYFELYNPMFFYNLLKIILNFRHQYKLDV
jgi:hypothetical protein